MQYSQRTLVHWAITHAKMQSKQLVINCKWKCDVVDSFVRTAWTIDNIMATVHPAVVNAMSAAFFRQVSRFRDRTEVRHIVRHWHGNKTPSCGDRKGSGLPKGLFVSLAAGQSQPFPRNRGTSLWCTHKRNVRFLNVWFQNVRFQNVRFQYIRFLKSPVFKCQVFKTFGGCGLWNVDVPSR